MINLIPNKEKKEMAKGFYYRLVVLFLLTASTAFIIGIVAILPSYVLSSAKERIIDNKLEVQKQEPVPLPDQETLKVIEDLDKKLKLIENSTVDEFTISEKVINAILLKKIPGIKIADILYQNDLAKGKKINIQGTAPSREVLLSFRQALEKSVNFKQVDLPISNFVKGSNIEFYLRLIPL